MDIQTDGRRTTIGYIQYRLLWHNRALRSIAWQKGDMSVIIIAKNSIVIYRQGFGPTRATPPADLHQLGLRPRTRLYFRPSGFRTS